MRRSSYAIAGAIALAVAGTAMIVTSLTTGSTPAVSGSRAVAAVKKSEVVPHLNASGHVTFVAAPAGRPLPATGGGNPGAIARANINDFAPLFGIAHPKTDLTQVTTLQVGAGSIARFQQKHNGVPVIAGQLVVSQTAKGALEAISGEASTTDNVSTTASVSARQAALAAVNATAAASKISAGSLSAETPVLSIYDPSLLNRTDPLGTRIVYQVTVTDAANPAINQYVLVDARTGAVALAFAQNDAAFAPSTGPAVTKPAERAAPVAALATATVKVCDFTNILSTDSDCTSPVSNPGTSSNVDVKDAYTYTSAVNDFYNAVVGRGGIDGGNMPVISSVDYCPDRTDCPYQNSYWDGSQMVFGQGFPQAPDVVAHEYTHGVTQYSSGLLYYYQAGSINESMSDVMGELFDQYNGTDTNGKWIFGEKLPNSPDFERNMADPTQSGQGAQPDSMSSSHWSTDAWDSGGVHTDSGVGNKLAYLAAEGTPSGSPFNGVTVTGVIKDSSQSSMITKMARIWAGADAILTPGADYADLGNAVELSCTNLENAGTAGVTAADCKSVTDAVSATQLESTTSSHLPPQSMVCTNGATPTADFADNFNRSASGSIGTDWTESGPAEIDGYAAPGTSAGNQLYLPDPANDTAVTNVYAYTRAIALPAQHTNYLYFQHLDALDWYDGPHAGTPTSSVYMEGMYVEYQINGSTTWTQLTGTWSNGPSRTIDHTTLEDNTLYIGAAYAGTAFAGDSTGWTSSRATLSTALAGKSVRFRFRVQTDGFNWPTASYGEFLDNVEVNSCGGPPLAPGSVSLTGNHTSATLHWAAASSNGGDAVSSYEIYEIRSGSDMVARLSAAGSATSITMTGLTPGQYLFEVRAKKSGA